MQHAASTRSIISFLADLVRIPSRAGIDPYDPVLDAVSAWLSDRKVPNHFVMDPSGARIGVWGRIEGGQAGPCYLLNATVDTAAFGNESRWTYPPLSAAQANGWLYGRGSGDSKAGIAIFCHVLAALMPERKHWSGSLAYVFDAAEHTGEFSGIRRFMETRGNTMRLAGAMIGYPGNNRIATGGRGFVRARVRVHGQSAHTGSSHNFGTSAIWRAVQLIQAIHTTPLPDLDRRGFPLPPRLSVTAVEGGSGFSVVPDLCTLHVDVRLTLAFDQDAAKDLVGGLVQELDRRAPEMHPTEIAWFEGWPAYQLAADVPVARALRDTARSILGREVPAEVVGPSSVANLLYAQGVPATNGFGVTCESIHATDERIALESVEPVFEVYCRALRSLLST